MSAPIITPELLRARFDQKVADGTISDDPELRARFEAVLGGSQFAEALARDNAARPGAPATPRPAAEPIVPVRDESGVIAGWQVAEDAPATEDEPAEPPADGYGDPGADADADRRIWTCNSGIDPAAEPFAVPESTLDEAARIIAGNRENDYGPAERNLARIAGMWSAYLETTVTPRDVAWMMVQLKSSRDRHNPKRDNEVDGIGYIALMGELSAG